MKVYKALRMLSVLVILLGLGVPALLYVLLTLPPVGRFICDTAERELSALLGVEVSIEDVDFSPFNKLSLDKVTLITAGSDTDTIAVVDRLGAGINLSQLVFHRRVVVTHAEIIGLDARISRVSADAPLNIQPIIDALAPKDRTKPPTKFDLKINTVVIRSGAVSYDVLSAPAPRDGRFDPNHVAISNLRADVTVPRLANDDFAVNILQLAFIERSGVNVRNLSGDYHLTATALTVTAPSLDVNRSSIRLADIKLNFGSFNTMAEDVRSGPVDIALLAGTHIVPADLSPLVPALDGVDVPVDITAHVSGRLNDLNVEYFTLSGADTRVGLDFSGSVAGLLDSVPAIRCELPRVDLRCNGVSTSSVVGRFVALSPAVDNVLVHAGDITLTGSGGYGGGDARFDGKIASSLGNMVLNAAMTASGGGARRISGHIVADALDVATIASRADLGLMSMDADVDVSLDNRHGKTRVAAGSFDGTVGRLDFRGYSYSGITADVVYDGATARGHVAVDDPAAVLDIEGLVALGDSMPQLDLRARGSDISLSALNLYGKYAERKLAFDLEARLSGRSVNDAVGWLSIPSVSFATPQGRGLYLNDITLDVDNVSVPHRLRLRSEYADADVEGSYTVTSIPGHVRRMVSSILPGLVEPNVMPVAPTPDSFTFDIRLKPSERLDSMIRMPVVVAEDVAINGSFDGAAGEMSLNLFAPYVIKGNTLLLNTALSAEAYEADSVASLYFTTVANVNNRDRITLGLAADAVGGHIDTSVAWDYNRPARYGGNLSFSSRFSRDGGVDGTGRGTLTTRFTVNPTQFAVNDTVWSVDHGVVTVTGKVIDIDNIHVGREGQWVNVDGSVSPSADDVLTLDLASINLDYIFESLHLDKVMIGGDATGTFTASCLLSGEPRINTRNLHVEGIKYNRCLLGDADITAEWDNDTKSIGLHADVAQANGLSSRIDGFIRPLDEALDITFDCDRINVGFMRPFMSAFADDVDGLASGRARLFGTFHDLDLEGDVYAEDLRLKLGFTQVTYSATDSIHMRPGRIIIDDITMLDPYGNKALLDGVVTHEFFRRPTFDFQVTEARDFLVYDVAGTPLADRWYGRIFGNGTANIKGEPGVVDINVSMRTAPKSTFTFVLTDAEEADDYKFITFRDRDQARKDSIAAAARPVNPVVREWEANRGQADDDEPSVYNMDFQVAVTPQAEVVLVMDPIGGDRIRAHGSGDLRMTYSSGTEELRMYGDYTLDRGSYNFTLQDIILKDFSILDGSNIAFRGDPYAAQLNITGEYVVNANLSDLDESFLQDKDLNRTNVPVHARMLITGDMRQPDIAFDLAFPTLNSDIDRKVKSIISTPEMMNRQIVYLLSLSRFYTPEYMSSTTKGNEFVSMASSTLSSQLSNALGQLSDNWSIAPNLRSDRGDFSDVEFDVALSSTLLNNRLLLNGNFGYRDNSLNNNSFIGDFDIEYLLNRTGTIRLKAYNRYNDQNYYVKSALTTQGVGVAFRRDFDSLFSFLRPLFGRKSKEATDSIPIPDDGEKK